MLLADEPTVSNRLPHLEEKLQILISELFIYFSVLFNIQPFVNMELFGHDILSFFPPFAFQFFKIVVELQASALS
jgi:hypothetical protein